MSAEYLEPGSLKLGGVPFRLLGPIQRAYLSTPPPKVVIGDQTKDDDQYASTLAISEARGGIGVYRLLDKGQADRCWWSTCAIEHRGLVTLPPRVYSLGSPGGSPSAVVKGVEHSGTMYFAFGTSYYALGADDTWGAAAYTVPTGSAPTDAAIYGGNLYWANGTTLTRLIGAAWSELTATPAKYLAVWDDKLFRIAEDGQLYYSTNPEAGSPTWVTSAKLPVPPGSVTKLFVYRDNTGDTALFAATKTGLYVLDFYAPKWYPTELQWPWHAEGGLGSVVWRGDLTTFVGLDGFRYTPGMPSTVDARVGLSADDGVPRDVYGTIVDAASGFNDLYALVDSSTVFSPIANPFATSATDPLRVRFWEPVGGLTTIFAYNGGWRVVWQNSVPGNMASTAQPGRALTVSGGSAKYRLYWAVGNVVYYTELVRAIRNPLHSPTLEYQEAAEHITPWYIGGWDSLRSLGLRLKVRAYDATATETIRVQYGLDLGEAWHDVATISAPGVYEWDLAALGLPYEYIRFRFVLSRGENAKLAPKLLYFTQPYLKILEPRWGWSFAIEIDDYLGYTAKQRWDALMAMVEQEPLLYITFHGEGIEEHKVKISHLVGGEGRYPEFYRGRWQVSVYAP